MVITLMMMCRRTGAIFQYCTRGRLSTVCDGKLQVIDKMKNLIDAMIDMTQCVPLMIKLHGAQGGIV